MCMQPNTSAEDDRQDRLRSDAINLMCMKPNADVLEMMREKLFNINGKLSCTQLGKESSASSQDMLDTRNDAPSQV